MIQSGVYELGYQRGKQKGEQKAVVLYYELRLGRTLTDSERTTLIARHADLGLDRLLIVPLTLSADALAAWLADPAAT